MCEGEEITVSYINLQLDVHSSILNSCQRMEQRTCPLANERIKKKCTHKHNRISFSQNKKILPIATTWIKLEDILLRGDSKAYRERWVLCDLTYMWSLKKPNSQNHRVKEWLLRAEEWGTWGGCWSKGYKFLLLREISSGSLIVVNLLNYYI